LGKAAVYSHGAGVSVAMMNYYETEKYLKELYGLDELEPPTRADSLRAAEFYPGPDSTIQTADTLANAETESESEPEHKSTSISIHKPKNLEHEKTPEPTDENIEESHENTGSDEHHDKTTHS